MLTRILYVISLRPRLSWLSRSSRICPGVEADSSFYGVVAFFLEPVTLDKINFIKSNFRVLTVSLFGVQLAQLAVRGANGKIELLAQHEADTGRLCRSHSLQASDDGKSVIFIETDELKVGIQRE